MTPRRRLTPVAVLCLTASLGASAFDSRTIHVAVVDDAGRPIANLTTAGGGTPRR